MELVALVVGLVAAATILPALVLLCGTKHKYQEAHVGASMASRRGAAGGGTLQIDPILQPDWAAKQAARDAADKKQLAVIMSSKQARLHRAGGGGEDAVHVVMRQPSTMADKFALPSHLTKQLGQPSRRGLANGGGAARGSTPLQDASVEGIPQLQQKLTERKSLSPPLARPELALTATGSLSASITRSGVNDSSINVRTSAGSEIPGGDLYHRALNNSNTSTGSRKALGMGSSLSPESSSVVVPVSEMFPADGAGGGGLRERGSGGADPRVGSGHLMRGSGSGIAWPGLNDSTFVSGGGGGGDRSADSSRRQPLGGATQPTAGVVLDGPRVSYPHPHPRVAALSPLPSSSRAQQQQQQRQQLQDQDQEREEEREEDLQPSSNFVEHLTPGVDWSAAPVGSESARRASYAIGTTANPGDQIPARIQDSAPTMSDSGGRRSGSGAAAAGAGASYRTLGGGSGGGRAISSHDLHGRAPHLPSPLGGQSLGALGDREAPGSAGGGRGGPAGSTVSKRWTANGGLTPPAPTAAAVDLGVGETRLPGSAECVVIRPELMQGGSAALAAGSRRSLLLMRGDGGGASGGRSDPDDTSGHQALRLSFGGDRAKAAAVTAAAAAAAAASVTAATAAGRSFRSLGGGDGGRTNLTWSGMAAAPLVDVEAGPGPGVLTTAGEGPLGSGPPGSRAARAQALLARNRTNLSRLAATATAGSAGTGWENPAPEGPTAAEVDP